MFWTCYNRFKLLYLIFTKLFHVAPIASRMSDLICTLNVLNFSIVLLLALGCVPLIDLIDVWPYLYLKCTDLFHCAPIGPRMCICDKAGLYHCAPIGIWELYWNCYTWNIPKHSTVTLWLGCVPVRSLILCVYLKFLYQIGSTF